MDSAQKGLYYDDLSITANVTTQLQGDYKKLVKYSKVLSESVKNDDEKIFEAETKNLFKTRLLDISSLYLQLSQRAKRQLIMYYMTGRYS